MGGMTRWGLIALVLAAVAPRPALGDRPKSYPYQVVATTGMVGDIVKEVAGEKAEVTNLIGAGVDPHLYRVTRNDVVKLLRADVVFYNGLALEGKMTDALVRVARKKPVYPVTELLDERYLLEPEELAGHYDPHVWMDVKAWTRATQAVAAMLAEFDPQHADHYQLRAEHYGEQLEQLDQYIRTVIGSVPKQQRVLITAHDAFNYFGRAYGMRVEGIQGISTESEAGLRRINGLVDLIVDSHIRAVFVETSVADRNVKALIEGAKARGYQVTIGGELFSDAMGTPGTYRGTYVGMLDHNATVISRALGGQAPEKGMRDKLTEER